MKQTSANKKIGALVIGQTPRPDLVDPLQALLPEVVIEVVGALDGLSATELPDASHAPYPLSTMMAGERCWLPRISWCHAYKWHSIN